MSNKWWAKLLRFLSIFLLGVTSLFTLAGGAGTTCVALDAAKYGEPMSAIAPYQWLYLIFVVVTVAIGIAMTRATILLAKGQGKGYKPALLSLILGVVVGIIHIVVSRWLRGASMPVDGVVYVTILTLVIFLLLRLPPIWNAVQFDRIKGSDDDINRIAGSATLLACGLLTLTVQYWAGPTHTWGNTNWSDAWHISMWILGSGMMLGGIGVLLWKHLPVRKQALVQQ